MKWVQNLLFHWRVVEGTGPHLLKNRFQTKTRQSFPRFIIKIFRFKENNCVEISVKRTVLTRVSSNFLTEAVKGLLQKTSAQSIPKNQQNVIKGLMVFKTI